MTEIRTLEHAHIPGVVAMWNAAIEHEGEGFEERTLTEKRLSEIMADPSYLPPGALVAFSGGECVGFAMGYVQRVDFREVGGLAEMPGRLAGIAVRPSHQRQGTGARLVREVEQVLAAEGKTAIAFETYRQPIALGKGFHLDTGPYRFMVARGYRPLGHELVLRNDLAEFRLSDAIRERRDRYADEGITFDWYRPEDRDELVDFMERHFRGGWNVRIRKATAADRPPVMLLPRERGRIMGFMGPFHVTPGAHGAFSSPGIAPEYRRRGIGTVMWGLGLDYLKRQGCTHTQYTTGALNPARFMYFRSGARLVNIFCAHLQRQLAD